jgi:uncharacterized C2H2 Zn-finger protein
MFQMGQRVDGELIVDCPYCHRSAVRRSGDMIRFVRKTRIVHGNCCTLLRRVRSLQRLGDIE